MPYSSDNLELIGDIRAISDEGRVLESRRTTAKIKIRFIMIVAASIGAKQYNPDKLITINSL